MKLSKLIVAAAAIIIAAAAVSIATPARALTVAPPRVVVLPPTIVIPRVTAPTLPRLNSTTRYNTPVYRTAPVVVPPYIGPARKCDRTGKVC